MELWIRSQDKQWLIPVNDIISVFQKNVFCKGIILGEYKSEERALEILNEIQYHIKHQGESLATSDNGIITGFKYYSNVYEMPEK